jgi:UDP-glucose 4-epimerase
MKKIVITGPTGTIGLALIKKCIEENVGVIAICRRNSEGIKKIPKSPLIKIIECDLDELNTVELKGNYDTFYHFAWAGTIGDVRNDMYLQNLNIKYTIDAVNLAHRLGCITFIGAGSQAEYGRVDGILSPNTPTNPENGYGIAKLCAGKMSKVLCEKLKINHIWVRVLSIYGPDDDTNTLVMSTIQKLLNNELPKFTAGEQKWDFLYSEDAANALFKLGFKTDESKVYCLGSGYAIELKQYIEIIKSIINPHLKLKYGEIPYNALQVMHLHADIEQLKIDINFDATTSFENGIKSILLKNFNWNEKVGKSNVRL